MDKLSLAALLDGDREMLLANLARDRSLPAAQATLEKAVDRVMYRYTEAAESEALRDGAQHILQAMKNAMPMIDVVGEARAWKKEAAKPEKKGLRLGPMAVAALLLGLVLVLASVLAVMLSGHMGGALTFVKALLPTALGCGLLFWAGISAASPKKKRRSDAQDDEAVRIEYLVDVEKAFHVLHGAMLLADGQLERIREESALAAQRRADARPADVSGEALELFSELLEAAYAAKDDGARESISAIRFYLHNAQIDVADFEAGRESWFEFLPADRPGTLRPALVSGGKLLKKGMAAR